jgi:putative hydrolase of the HAD superfamily
MKPPHIGRQQIALDVDAIVLDIDDTLYLERDYVRSGFESVGDWVKDELGFTDFKARAWDAFEAGTRGRIFDHVLASYSQSPDPFIVKEMVTRYRSHAPNISLLDDARNALTRWCGATAVAAITDGPLDSQQAKARALGLDEWIPLIVFTAALGAGRGKPHPEAFSLVQEHLGLDSAACAYIADNPGKDFIAPKDLGWATVRIRRDLGLHAGVVGGQDIDYEVASLDQVVLAPHPESVGVDTGEWG